MGETFLTGLLRTLEGWIWRRRSQTCSRQLANKSNLSRKATAGTGHGEASTVLFLRRKAMAGSSVRKDCAVGAGSCLTPTPTC